MTLAHGGVVCPEEAALLLAALSALPFLRGIVARVRAWRKS